MAGTLAFIWVILGVLAAFAGAELAARGLSALGRGALFVIGALAAAAAASAPEFLFSTRAAADDTPGLALGLVAGSLLANALVAAPLAAGGASEASDRVTKVLGLWSALGALTVVGFAFDGAITRVEGMVLTLGALLAAGFTAVRARPDVDASRQKLTWSLVGLVAGAGLLIAGAAVSVDAAVASPLMSWHGGLLTGVALFGLAAALPEIAAAAVAARRGHGGAGLANVTAGAAMTAFGALGVAAWWKPLAVPPAFMGFPAIAMVSSAVLLALLAAFGGRLPRLTWIVGLALYLVALAVGWRLLA